MDLLRITSSGWWMLALIVLGCLVGAGGAVYLPAWVSVVLTIAMVFGTLWLLTKVTHHGGAFLLVLSMALFFVPFWVSWFAFHLFGNHVRVIADGLSSVMVTF